MRLALPELSTAGLATLELATLTLTLNTLYNPELLSIGTQAADKIATLYGKR